MTQILSKTAKKAKYIKKYKCPYCEERLIREDLIDHVEKTHMDVIPKGYTPTRVVFNTINKKDHGNCVICRKPTIWNENIHRYNRYCSEKCIKEAARRAEKNTGRHEQLRGLDGVKYQKEMLDHRSISGTYKFSSNSC